MTEEPDEPAWAGPALQPTNDGLVAGALVDQGPGRRGSRAGATSTTNVMLARKLEDELGPPRMTGPGPDPTHPASLRRT